MMDKYIDILVTQGGVFCAAPPWTVKVGDLVGLPHTLTGEHQILTVVAVATDTVDGEHTKLIEKYIGAPLPKITARYMRSEVEWDADVHE